MALQNKSMYAILGILSLSPGTGYDIKMYSDRVLSGFWHENFGHIYPTLKTLLEAGMITVVGGGDEKRITYAITDQGRAELDAWLMQSTARQPARSEFLLKLLFSSDQPTQRVIDMLREYQAQHRESRERYAGIQRELSRGMEAISPQRARFLSAVLGNGVASSDAVIRWCDELIALFQGELRYTVQPMTAAHAKTIMTWHYPNEYAMYSFTEDEETFTELTGGEYFACLDAQGALAGYFCFGQPARIPTDAPYANDPAHIDIGLGLAPERCGRGYGKGFLHCGIEYAEQTLGAKGLRLAVAAFNQRAIALYEHCGFRKTDEVTHKSSKMPFSIMQRP